MLALWKNTFRFNQNKHPDKDAVSPVIRQQAHTECKYFGACIFSFARYTQVAKTCLIGKSKFIVGSTPGTKLQQLQLNLYSIAENMQREIDMVS